ncbi:MAG: tetratricopeptide repeat protein [Synechococcus sp.]
MGQRSKAKHKQSSKKKHSGKPSATEPERAETRATAKLRVKRSSDADRPKSRPKSAASQRSWLYRFVLIAAVAAFVGFSLLPALGGLKGLKLNFSNATAQLSVEQVQKEIDGYELVLEREPDNELALQGLTNDLLQLGRFEAAIAPLQKLVAIQPDRVGLSLELGQLQVQAGQVDEGLQTLQALYEDYPERPDVLETLVDADLSVGKSAAAIALLEQKHRKGATVEISLLLAKAYRTGDRFADAMTVYDRLLDSEPTDFRPAFEKAIALTNAPKEQRNFEEAQKLFERAETTAPGGISARIREIAKSYRAFAADLEQYEAKANSDAEQQPASEHTDE